MQASHYQIGEMIGQGGMGRVFKATDTRLDRTVALKIIDRSPISDNWEAGFLQEAKVLASLQHPNIVTLFDMGVVDGKPFLVMEYLEGRTIQSLLLDRIELPFRQTLGVGVQICDALAYAHSKGVIHRDIKPGNVFLLRDNTVKVVDFGLSITGPSFRPLPPTVRTEVPCGTYQYMSPEQRQGFAVDGQTDVYSTGLVLHELLANQTISTNATTADANLQVKSANGYLPVALGSEYCDEVNSILCAALAQERLLRFDGARQLGRALLNLKQRVERSEITSLYKRGCALIETGDMKTHDHEITKILIELDSIDPACEEGRMLMDQGLRVTFMNRVAEIVRLTEEKKFVEAEQMLKPLYMQFRPTPDYVAQVDSLASYIRTQAANQGHVWKANDESHRSGESSSNISGKVTERLKNLLSTCRNLLRH